MIANLQLNPKRKETMNWLKLITKKGRQEVVRDILKETITTDVAAKYGAQGVNSLLGRVNDKEKLGAVALNLEQGASLVADISAAIKDGEVTADEAANITAKTSNLLGNVVTQDKVDSLIETLVAKVP